MFAHATRTGPGRVRLLIHGAIHLLVLALALALTPEVDAAAGVFQGNTLLTLSLITNRALFVLENSLTAAGKINREYDDRFAVSGAKIGAYADVRKPPRFISQDGPDIVVQDVDESSVQIRVDKNKVVPFQFSNIDKVLSIDDYSERFLVPAISQLANDVDEEVCAIVNEIPYFIGTPGVVPAASSTYTKAHAILDYNAVPRNAMRTMIVTPDMEVNLVEALKGLFHQGEAISMQFKSNHMGHAFGWDFSMDQNCLTHQIGTWAGTDPLVDGASQSGNAINSDGWGVASMKKGDVIQMAGVYHVNPKSRKSTGKLQPFVLTADVDAAGGDIELPLSPALVGPDANGNPVKDQTVSALPANNAVITVFGHKSNHSGKQTPQGFGFHRDFATLATVDLQLPDESHKASRASDKQLGLSLSIIEGYNINNNTFPCRIDILFGVDILREELCARVLS